MDYASAVLAWAEEHGDFERWEAEYELWCLSELSGGGE